MPITLGSNIASLAAQRRLADGSASLAKTFERLSSGQRINRAIDDAAGLALADGLNAFSQVFGQGVRNFTDGLSLVTIAETAVEQLSSIVIRLQELAEQSANGVYTDEQRLALDTEAQALSDEYARIIDATKFNEMHLLNGEVGELRLQGGFGVHGSLVFEFGSVQGGGSGPVLIGTGSFGAATPFSVGPRPQSVTSGDFNGDGVLDLVTGDNLESTATVLLGVGDGSFGGATSFAVGVSPTENVTTGDFNGDGELDLVTADGNGVTVSVLLGVGNGSFCAVTSFSVGSFPAQVAGVSTGDFNGDDVLDLVTADGNGNTVSVLLGLGNGSFGAATPISVGAKSMFVTSADFNGDDVLDLVTADTDGTTVSVLLGVGNGSFGAATSFSVGAGPTGIAMGDFNGDEVLDLVTTDRNADTVSVLLGVGNGSFGASTQFSVGDRPFSVTSGDFNGDGVLDLVTADYNDGSVSVLLGETTSSGSGGGGGGASGGIEPLDPFSLKTVPDALISLAAFQQTLTDLTAERGNLGAFQSRLGFAISTLEVKTENFRAAEARIRDADIAYETARLVSLQVLQESGTAILAQANQQTALALQLLDDR
jgi:flagellin-like hook-associated protein FlgL